MAEDQRGWLFSAPGRCTAPSSTTGSWSPRGRSTGPNAKDEPVLVVRPAVRLSKRAPRRASRPKAGACSASSSPTPHDLDVRFDPPGLTTPNLGPKPATVERGRPLHHRREEPRRWPYPSPHAWSFRSDAAAGARGRRHGDRRRRRYDCVEANRRRIAPGSMSSDDAGRRIGTRSPLVDSVSIADQIGGRREAANAEAGCTTTADRTWPRPGPLHRRGGHPPPVPPSGETKRDHDR